MEKIKWTIKIIIQILVVITMYIFLDKVLKDLIAIKWLGVIIFGLIILYFDLKEIEIEPIDDSKELFNTYYNSITIKFIFDNRKKVVQGYFLFVLFSL